MSSLTRFPRQAFVVALAPAILVTASLVVPAQVSAMPEPEELIDGFSTCRQLNAEYEHGVSNRLRGRKWWIKRGATGVGLYCPRVYRQVKADLDRDRDHIACEN